ncbi:MAG: CvpA family protein [Burkholderiaceae bacterium]|nr:MAG: CvpA family protein [Burkholderiaceae bacterium]MBE7426314.1 CvpA family protein [Ideonella sp.]MCC7287376.1 CvpA family protein [Burkholderiaceae bacterium]
MHDIGWVDWALLAVLLVSVLVGLVRGLVFEVLSLLGWVAAFVAAQAWSAEVALHVPVGASGSALNHGAAFAIVFVLALIAWMLAAKLIRLIVHATPLTLIDRTLGGVFGFVRALVLLLAVAMVVSFTPAVRAAPWQASHGAAWLGVLLSGLKPVLPPAVSRHLQA